MSSTAYINTLNFVSAQVNIYFGLFILITNIFGQICNILVFTSLKTFRETTCAFYLTVISIINLGQTLPICLRVLLGFNVNSSTSGLFCQFRWAIGQFCAMVSITCLCLSTIDQFLSMTNYRHLNNIKLARRHVAIACIVWLIHTVFIFIYYDSNQHTCIITNAIFAKYFTRFYLLFIFGIIPLVIIIVFSVLAFLKARTIASRQVNLVRLSRDRQLTAMTLFHGLFVVITVIPYVITYAYTLNVTTTDAEEIAHNQLLSTIAGLFCYESYAMSFYIYCCVSKRFRKQFVYVLIGIHLKRWQRKINNLNNNRVIPITEIHGRH